MGWHSGKWYTTEIKIAISMVPVNPHMQITWKMQKKCKSALLLVGSLGAHRVEGGRSFPVPWSNDGNERTGTHTFQLSSTWATPLTTCYTVCICNVSTWLNGMLLNCRPQRDGRLTWLTDRGWFTHNVGSQSNTSTTQDKFKTSILTIMLYCQHCQTEKYRWQTVSAEVYDSNISTICRWLRSTAWCSARRPSRSRTAAFAFFLLMTKKIWKIQFATTQLSDSHVVVLVFDELSISIIKTHKHITNMSMIQPHRKLWTEEKIKFK